MGDATAEIEEPHPKRARKVVNGREYTYGGASGMGAMLFRLPTELCNYILKLAVSAKPGRMPIHNALVEHQTSWQTLASLRLMRKRSIRPDDGLNAIFYESTLCLWMQRERVAYAEAGISKVELQRIQERDRDAFYAIRNACGRDNAAWKRALEAYKQCKGLPNEPNVQLPTS